MLLADYGDASRSARQVNLQSASVWPQSLFSWHCLLISLTTAALLLVTPLTAQAPAAAIQRAQGLWKVFGHAGSVAFSRTTDFEIGKFNDKHLLRRFGQVTDEYR